MDKNKAREEYWADRQCGDCLYYSGRIWLSPPAGQCRRLAPTNGGWDRTPEDGYCGDFKEVPTGAMGARDRQLAILKE